MAIDKAALKSELLTDPTGLGYAAQIALGSYQGCADLLNQPRGSITVLRPDVRGTDVFGSIVIGEYDALTASRRDFVNLLIAMSAVDATNATIRANVLAIFGAGTTTRANFAALAQRIGSRAEQLFGTGIQVTHADVGYALRG